MVIRKTRREFGDAVLKKLCGFLRDLILFVDDRKERREMRSKVRNEEQTDDCRAERKGQGTAKRRVECSKFAMISVRTLISGDSSSGRACGWCL